MGHGIGATTCSWDGTRIGRSGLGGSNTRARSGSGNAACSGSFSGAIGRCDIFGIKGTRFGARSGAGTPARSGACSGAIVRSDTLGSSGILRSIVAD